MVMFTMDAWVALGIATACGLVLRTVEKRLMRAKATDVPTTIREDLRADLAELHADLDRMERQLDASREEYYATLHLYNMAKGFLLEHGGMDEVREIEAMLRDRQEGA